jgi:hypothetical protein
VGELSAGGGVHVRREGVVELTAGGNVRLGEPRHVAHIPERGGVQVLPNDRLDQDYRADLAVQAKYRERRACLRAVLIPSFLAGIVLAATASLPARSYCHWPATARGARRRDSGDDRP